MLHFRPLLKGVGIDQRVNEQLPLDLMFRNESGKDDSIKEYFNSKNL